MGIAGNRRFNTVKISCRAAPVGEVMMPMVFGNKGSGFFLSAENNPA
jgi:hypothetical protein